MHDIESESRFRHVSFRATRSPERRARRSEPGAGAAVLPSPVEEPRSPLLGAEDEAPVRRLLDGTGVDFAACRREPLARRMPSWPRAVRARTAAEALRGIEGSRAAAERAHLLKAADGHSGIEMLHRDDVRVLPLHPRRDRRCGRRAAGGGPASRSRRPRVRDDRHPRGGAEAGRPAGRDGR